ncbi:MAG TPA: M48 family metalloprotease [Candidatus Saccharimonadales bacterium]|nr:M48 family metalloprotease [Candidatus Saccharimonadales bacterium]
MKNFKEKSLFLGIIFGLLALPILSWSSYEDMLSEAKTRLNCSKDISIVEHTDNDDYARAYCNKISINRNLLDAAPLGFRRMILFHEVVHMNHNDYLVHDLLKKCILFGGSGLVYALSKNINEPLLRAAASLALATTSAVIATDKYSKFMEMRADTKAANALGCEICLHEFNDHLERARIAENVNEIVRTDKGYLSGSQIAEIAKTFKDQKCQQHNQQS